MERLIPGDAPRPIFLEHMARYEFASPLVEGARVLDVACGSGYGSYELAVRGRAAGVVGVDISRTAIEYCRSHYQAENLVFEVGDATSLKFADNSFNIVISLETIEHLSAVGRYLDEIYRVTKPGGSCLVSTPNKRLAFANPFHRVEFSYRQFREAMTGRFSEVRFFGQDRLPLAWRLFLEASVMVSRTIPEGVKRIIIPERARVDSDEREVGGIIDHDVSSCRFFLVLCRR